MARELKFGLDVLESAEFQPNADQFFARAYLGSDVVGNYRTLPGIKHSTEIAYTLFASILKAARCDFESSQATLGTVLITVDSLSAMIEICQFEVEQSFVVTQMAAGANNFSAPAFLAYFWEQASAEISEEIELIRWQGEKGGTFSDEEDFLGLVDGYEHILSNSLTGVTATSNGTGTQATYRVNVGKKGIITSVDVLTAGAYSVAPTTLTLANAGEGSGATFAFVTSGVSPNIAVDSITVLTGGIAYPQIVVSVSGTTITAANVLTEMGKVFSAQPREIRRRKDLLRWYVPPSVADFYRQATAVGNTLTYITKALDLTYLDIKLIVCDGMSDDTMVLTRWENMGYAFDAAGDEDSLVLVDMKKSTAEPKLRARTELKIGFFCLNKNEIVFYN